jgi:hypothetical protein
MAPTAPSIANRIIEAPFSNLVKMPVAAAIEVLAVRTSEQRYSFP